MASIYNNIGEVYRHQAKYPKAMEMYTKSLEMQTKKLGPDHLVVAKTYNKYKFVFSFFLL